jgi:hypothetical protein
LKDHFIGNQFCCSPRAEADQRAGGHGDPGNSADDGRLMGDQMQRMANMGDFCVPMADADGRVLFEE